MRIAAVGDPLSVQALKLMGIAGVAASTAAEASAALDESAVPDTVVLVTESVVRLVREKVGKMKVARQNFMIVEIPSVEGAPRQAEEIARLVSQTIGIKV